MSHLTNKPIDVSAVVRLVEHPAAGAVASFVGVVRDHNDGKAITRLEYHAYDTMAETEIAAIVAEVEASHPDLRVACVHRLGELAVTDVAVVCVASSPHRGEAFAACRQLIDEVKARVPIWKREHGPEGPYWVGWKDARCGGDHAHD